MDIKVGAILPTGDSTHHNEHHQNKVEVRLLAIRPPRRRSREKGKNRRGRRSAGRDPVNGRVLVMMVPDATQLPDGLATGEYRVFINFVRR